MKYFLLFLVLVFAAASIGQAKADSPIVSNVAIAQLTDGMGLVHITYDVYDADDDTVTISLQLSDDGGVTYNFPVLNLGGDIGPGIAPGLAKIIVWDAGSIPDPLLIESLQARVVASDVGTDFTSHSPRLVAITDGSSFDWSDPATIEKFSRADICIVMGSHLWMGGAHATENVIDQLKALNPDIVMIGYVSVKSAQLSGLNNDPESYWYKWYVRTEPYFVTTTTGDIAQDWPTSRLINILEPGCRAAMIETIMEMQNNSLNVFDGVMWDYFNRSLWVSPEVDVTGDPDMDNDGVGHWDDLDEMRAYRLAQEDLVKATRDSLGESFIQIFNGQRAYGDQAFAALADGAFYELFPTLFFPDPDMQNALDPNYQNSLFNVRSWFRTQNGGPYLVLSNVWYNAFIDNERDIYQIISGDKFRAIALLSDTYASWNSSPDGNPKPVYNWTSHEVSLGQPAGPVVFDGAFIRRSFQYGRVEIEMGSGAYPYPFDYRIWSLGKMVSELDKPLHTP